MRTFAVAALFALSTVACAVTPAPTALAATGAQSSGGQPAAPTADVPSSGGATLATAQSIGRGTTIEGWSAQGHPRYYRVEPSGSGEVSGTLYVQIMGNEGPSSGLLGMLWILGLDAAVRDQYGLAVYQTQASGRSDRVDFSPRIPSSEPFIIHFDCEKCLAEYAVYYKLVIK